MNKKLTSAVKEVKHNLHQETIAINDYKRGEKIVDSKTASLFRHICKEEEQHHRELAKRLAELRKQ
jgi:rubrerythrin